MPLLRNRSLFHFVVRVLSDRTRNRSDIRIFRVEAEERVVNLGQTVPQVLMAILIDLHSRVKFIRVLFLEARRRK